jgi:hypothetical protein
MYKTILPILLWACVVSALVAQQKPAAAPAQSAAATITDSQRFEFLKLQAKASDLRSQLVQAQAQLQEMGKNLQTQYDAMTRTCSPAEQFDSENLKGTPKEAPAKAGAK